MIEGEYVLAPQLRHLKVSEAFSGDDGAASIFKAVGTRPMAFQSVQTLAVVSRHMKVNACRALGPALQNALPKLQKLRLLSTPSEATVSSHCSGESRIVLEPAHCGS